MKIYLAGVAPCRGGQDRLYDDVYKNKLPYILESFYYADADTERLIPYMGDFLLDSGAFTFIQNTKKKVDWNEYLERYADFIRRNNVEKFFELDIDSVVGYDKVKELRTKLERETGRQCMPVWHRNRGIAEYRKLCDEYPYIAIGGIAIKEIKKTEYPAFKKMIKEAHERNCKVHGLGFTQISELSKYHFDSVDSSAWTAGNQFGYVYIFTGRTFKKIHAPEGSRLIKPKEVALHNFKEWIKFQQYADKHL